MKRPLNEKQGKMIRFSMSGEELLKVGDTFPQFTAHDIDGKEWKSLDIDSKVMVLNCWFTGCGPCRGICTIEYSRRIRQKFKWRFFTFSWNCQWFVMRN